MWGSRTVLGTDYKQLELREDGWDYLSLALILNILAALSMVGLFVACRQFRRSNVEQMEREKMMYRGSELTYRDRELGVLDHLLGSDSVKQSNYTSGQYLSPRHSQISASSTLADISRMTDISLISPDHSLASPQHTDLSA